MFTPHSLLEHWSLLAQYLRYGWETFEGQIYIAFVGVSTLVVYIALFPAMQFVYKHVTADRRGKGSRLAQESSGSSDIPDLTERTSLLQDGPNAHMAEESVTQDGSNAGDTIRKDQAFFVLGMLLSAFGYILIVIFDTPAIQFIGKEHSSTNCWKRQ